MNDGVELGGTLHMGLSVGGSYPPSTFTVVKVCVKAAWAWSPLHIAVPLLLVVASGAVTGQPLHVGTSSCCSMSTAQAPMARVQMKLALE